MRENENKFVSGKEISSGAQSFLMKDNCEVIVIGIKTVII